MPLVITPPESGRHWLFRRILTADGERDKYSYTSFVVTPEGLHARVIPRDNFKLLSTRLQEEFHAAFRAAGYELIA